VRGWQVVTDSVSLDIVKLSADRNEGRTCPPTIHSGLRTCGCQCHFDTRCRVRGGGGGEGGARAEFGAFYGGRGWRCYRPATEFMLQGQRVVACVGWGGGTGMVWDGAERPSAVLGIRGCAPARCRIEYGGVSGCRSGFGAHESGRGRASGRTADTRAIGARRSRSTGRGRARGALLAGEGCARAAAECGKASRQGREKRGARQSVGVRVLALRVGETAHPPGGDGRSAKRDENSRTGLQLIRAPLAIREPKNRCSTRTTAQPLHHAQHWGSARERLERQ